MNINSKTIAKKHGFGPNKGFGQNFLVDRLAIKKINQAMSLERALKNHNIPDKRLEEMAILNGMGLDERLEAGTLIKVVE